MVLQNIHLVTKWLPHLEKLVEESLESANPHFRLFVSAEAAISPDFHTIPQGILEASIKITNESPTGIKANLHRALDNFTQEMLVRLMTVLHSMFLWFCFSVFFSFFSFFYCAACRSCAQRKVNSKRYYFHYAISIRAFRSGANLVRKDGIYRIHSVLVI